MKLLRKQWDSSYKRKENFIFFPNEEVVKFISRFVRKKVGFTAYKDLLDFSKKVRGLDYGCGIGAQTILMRQFGIVPYGMDISLQAISFAKEFAERSGCPDIKANFILAKGSKIPFKNNFFDITISNAVLDSMTFNLARKLIKEFDRVTGKFLFLSLIAGDDHQHYREFNKEEIVKTRHEKGTIQSYFNWEKVERLIAGTKFKIVWGHLVTDESLLSPYKYGRYYIVLTK
jgi:SAM-dependent methyltransferase